MIRNFYQCPICKTQWDSAWHGVVAEECHHCGEKSIFPADSKIDGEPEKKREFFSARTNRGGTWHVISYRTDPSGEIRSETLIDGISEKAAAKIAACGNLFVASIREANKELKRR